MKIEILRSVMISGEPAAVGSIHEVSYSDGLLLVGMGKAKPAPEMEEVVEEPKPADVEPPRRGRKAAQQPSSED